jgi:hypothetical protein
MSTIEQHMRVHRRRRYLPRSAFVLLLPAFRYSPTRDAYVLRVVGNKLGPVLREERRARALAFSGPDRRRPGAAT